MYKYIKCNNSVKVKVTGGSCNKRWVYETMTDPVQIIFNINNVPCNFFFHACYGRYIVDGMDCIEVGLVNNLKDFRYNTSGFLRLTVSGGGYRTYPLNIPESVIESEPKANQKDFGFTGTFYSTQPIVKYCKQKLLDLFNNHIEYFNPKFLDAIGVSIDE